MTKIMYRVMFDNGNAVTFESTVDIDFHKIGVSTYGAGSLAFDDTFINLQHVVFIDKEVKLEEKVERSSENKGCSTCKCNSYPLAAEPCFSCIHGACDENLNRTERWEAE